MTDRALVQCSQTTYDLGLATRDSSGFSPAWPAPSA
jgi:hypothetical protein